MQSNDITKILEDSWSVCAPYVNQATKCCEDAVEVSDFLQITKNPFVSVLVLAWRHEGYIEECIESICSQQTSFSFEVVIGEDCSPDATRDKCFHLQRKYPSYVRVIYSKNNVGFVENMLRIVNLSRGRYVAICEGDDFWIDKNKLEKEVAILEEKRDVVLVHTGALQQFEHAKWTRCPASNKTVRSVLEINELSASGQRKVLLTAGNYIQTPTVVCDTNIFRGACAAIDGIEAKTGWLPSVDFIWWILCMRCGKSYYIQDNTAVRRINAGSLTAIPDGNIANARIVGDIRNMLFLAWQECCDATTIEVLVGRLKMAEECCRKRGQRRRAVSSVRLLIKRILLALTRR